MIFADDLVVVTHQPLGKGSSPGYLFVETRRHAVTVADLTEAEAAAVGWAVTRAARALRQELAPEAVFSMVTGRSVAHFHQHVFARPPGTPDAVPWHDTTSWPERPRLDEAGLIDLVRGLRRRFA